MISTEADHSACGGVSRRPASTCRDPVDILLQEQERVRIAAGMIAILAEDLWQRGRECYAHSALSFFREEWPLRADDEEYSILPRLLVRPGTTSSDCRLELTLARNHDRIRHLIEELSEGLHALTASNIPRHPAQFAVNLIRVSELLFQHIDWETHTFFPWVQKRLTPAELAALRREMKERRGFGPSR